MFKHATFHATVDSNQLSSLNRSSQSAVSLAARWSGTNGTRTYNILQMERLKGMFPVCGSGLSYI